MMSLFMFHRDHQSCHEADAFPLPPFVACWAALPPRAPPRPPLLMSPEAPGNEGTASILPDEEAAEGMAHPVLYSARPRLSTSTPPESRSDRGVFLLIESVGCEGGAVIDYHIDAC